MQETAGLFCGTSSAFGLSASVSLLFLFWQWQVHDLWICQLLQVTDQHTKLPSSLSAFSTFLLGEVFAQVCHKSTVGSNICLPWRIVHNNLMDWATCVFALNWWWSLGRLISSVTASRKQRLPNQLEQYVQCVVEKHNAFPPHFTSHVCAKHKS